MSTHNKEGFPWWSGLWALGGVVLGIPTCAVVLAALLEAAGILASSPHGVKFDGAAVFAALMIAALCWFAFGHLRRVLSWIFTPGPLRLDAEGLAFGQRLATPYADIAALRYDRPDDTLTLRTAHNRKILLWLSNWSNEDAIVARLNEEVRARLLPDAERLLAAGETLRFGPVAITRAGVLRRGRVVPWDAIRRIRVEAVNTNTSGLIEDLVFDTATDTFKFESSKILNEAVLHGCLARYLKS